MQQPHEIQISEIRAFILAQPDDRPVNMEQGIKDSHAICGCAMVHFAEQYAEENNFLPNEISCGFCFISFNNEAKLVLTEPIFSLFDATPFTMPLAKTYGELKKLLKA